MMCFLLFLTSMILRYMHKQQNESQNLKNTSCKRHNGSNMPLLWIMIKKFFTIKIYYIIAKIKHILGIYVSRSYIYIYIQKQQSDRVSVLGSIYLDNIQSFSIYIYIKFAFIIFRSSFIILYDLEVNQIYMNTKLKHELHDSTALLAQCDHEHLFVDRCALCHQTYHIFKHSVLE